MRTEKIKEIIVVEGKNDTHAIRRAVHADTIETNGSEISDQTLEEIKRAHLARGVIVFTDPDAPGERIRRIISQRIPEVKHAFLPRHLAKGNCKIGIEHATPESIRQALGQVRTEIDINRVEEPILTWEEYLEYGFSGCGDSKMLRQKVAEELQIGYANGKQFYHRLHVLQVSREELRRAIDKVKGQK